jgi:hypothetical protein
VAVAPTAAAIPMAVVAGFTEAAILTSEVAVGSTSAAADTPAARVFAAGAQPHRVKRVVARLVARPGDLVDCLRVRMAIPRSSEAAAPARMARAI